jgi:hypothetical protein
MTDVGIWGMGFREAEVGEKDLLVEALHEPKNFGDLFINP